MEKKLLIIEDETDIREAMAEAAKQENFQVLVGTNGQEGLEIALAEKPDLILLDIVMPVMDGHEVLERLRNDPWGQSVKVIMLTSMDDVKNIGDATANDITEYIIKAHSSLDDIMRQVRLAIYS
jgi:DNA-binding response OmpR family regulator